MVKCVTGKRVFLTALSAEEVLVELWSKNNYTEGHGPLAIYRCDECGYYHLTSQGEMNPALRAYLASDKYKRQQQANRWLDKFKGL